MSLLTAFKKVLPILIIVASIAAAVTYIMFKICNEKAYNEKWKDYIDCGIA